MVRILSWYQEISVDDFPDRVISVLFLVLPWTLGHWKTRAGGGLLFQSIGLEIGGVQVTLSAAGTGI